MIPLTPHFIVDPQQNRQSVVITLPEWRLILDELEELEDIRAYDRAKAGPQMAIPFAQALKELGADSPS